jgi:hypothetical protein
VIKKFNGYINEDVSNVKEVPLFFSPKFTEILKSVDSKISRELLAIAASGQKFQTSYIDILNIDFLTTIAVNRIGRIEGVTEQDLEKPSDNSSVWGERFRQPVRIGAFVAKLLPKYAGSKDLEIFVHQIKGKLDAGNYELRIVKGEEIRKWYLVTHYFNPTPGIEEPPEDEGVVDVRTPLMRSCLKQPEKQDFFDIYCENTDQVGMLIMLNSDKKLVARAIVWFDCFVVDKPESPTKCVLMDRIYYTQESDVNIMIDHAKQNGWVYKPKQEKEIFSFVMNGDICNKPITTKLKVHGIFQKYPYMDTMCFYTPDTGRLSSSRGKPAINPKSGEIMERYQLQRANGGTKRLSRER